MPAVDHDPQQVPEGAAPEEGQAWQEGQAPGRRREEGHEGRQCEMSMLLSILKGRIIFCLAATTNYRLFECFTPPRRFLAWAPYLPTAPGAGFDEAGRAFLTTAGSARAPPDVTNFLLRACKYHSNTFNAGARQRCCSHNSHPFASACSPARAGRAPPASRGRSPPAT